MNSNSFCRKPTDNGHRCGLYWGHDGPHECCTLHVKRPGVFTPPPEGWKTWLQ